MPFNSDPHYKYKTDVRTLGSDATLFCIVFVVAALLVTAGICSVAGVSVTSMWVTVPAFLAGFAAAVGIVWPMQQRRKLRVAEWHREKARIAEAELQRKMEKMYSDASNVPGVRK